MPCRASAAQLAGSVRYDEHGAQQDPPATLPVSSRKRSNRLKLYHKQKERKLLSFTLTSSGRQCVVGCRSLTV
jgi:hypothetical protein